MLRIRMYGGTPLWRALRDPTERETLESELVGELGVLDVVVPVLLLWATLRVLRHPDQSATTASMPSARIPIGSTPRPWMASTTRIISTGLNGSLSKRTAPIILRARSP